MPEQVYEERDLGPRQSTAIFASLIEQKHGIKNSRVEVKVPEEAKLRVRCEQVLLKDGKLSARVFQVHNPNDVTVCILIIGERA